MSVPVVVVVVPVGARLPHGGRLLLLLDELPLLPVQLVPPLLELRRLQHMGL